MRNCPTYTHGKDDGRILGFVVLRWVETDAEPMLVDGRPFNAFANLVHAIDQVYHHWQLKNPDKVLYLWAVQICINQHDQEERTKPVAGMMRNIYNRAC